MNYVSVKGLKKVFGNAGKNTVTAVDGVDLEIPRGQFLAVMGPSGSGKTTLLHCIGGLTRPTEGQIVIDGTDITALGDRRLTVFRRQRIGVIFQAFNLIPTLTAEENIMLPILAGFRDVSKSKLSAALELLLERLQLAERRHHYPDALSGGEQQRVAIARALLVDFAAESVGGILLADEPTGNLDSANGETICRLLRELCAEREHTMMVVTHEQTVAQWADRVVTLKDGRIISDSVPTN